MRFFFFLDKHARGPVTSLSAILLAGWGFSQDPASANQVSRYLPPSRATWRSQEVLGWVPGQRSQSRGGQSSLTWAGQAAGAGRKARRARGSAAREPQRSGAALAAGPTRQSPTQRERCGAATQQADRRARSVDVPGTRALSGATEHPGKRSPVPPCAAHRALTQLRALRPPGSGCRSSKRRNREGLPAPGAPRLHRSPACWPRTTFLGSCLLSWLNLGAGDPLGPLVTSFGAGDTGCFQGCPRHGNLAIVGAGGDWRALSWPLAVVSRCVQVRESLLGIFLKFYEIMRAEVLLWLQGAGCVGATIQGSSGTGIFASDSGARAARDFPLRDQAPWQVPCPLAPEPPGPTSLRPHPGPRASHG